MTKLQFSIYKTKGSMQRRLKINQWPRCVHYCGTDAIIFQSTHPFYTKSICIFIMYNTELCMLT